MPYTPPCTMLKPTPWAPLAYPIHNIADHKMVALPGGQFVMGGPGFDDAKPHWVKLSPFCMATTTVTEGRFYGVTGRYGNQNAPAYHPATEVSWHDGHEYIERCNREYGTKIGYPTEAEWEYAARGPVMDVREFMEKRGMTSAQFLEWLHDGKRLENFVTQLQAGVDIHNDPEKVKNLLEGGQPLWAWHVYGSATGALNHDEVWFDQKGAAPVSWGPPNGFGLFGMSGGVWEWVGDFYKGDFYELNRDPKTQTRQDPVNITEGRFRGLRGGSWFNYVPDFLRAACRYDCARPGYRNYDFGFRVASSVPQDSSV